MIVSSQVAFMRFSLNCERLTRHAAKLREQRRIMNLIPIAKARTNQFRSRCPGGAFDDKMFAVEKIFGVIRIAGHVRREARERRKWSIRQFPAVADKFRDPPPAGPCWMGSHRRGRPGCEIKITVARGRSRFAPRVEALSSVRAVESSTVKLRFGR